MAFGSVRHGRDHMRPLQGATFLKLRELSKEAFSHHIFHVTITIKHRIMNFYCSQLINVFNADLFTLYFWYIFSVNLHFAVSLFILFVVRAV